MLKATNAKETKAQVGKCQVQLSAKQPNYDENKAYAQQLLCQHKLMEANAEAADLALPLTVVSNFQKEQQILIKKKANN